MPSRDTGHNQTEPQPTSPRQSWQALKEYDRKVCPVATSYNLVSIEVRLRDEQALRIGR